MGKRRENGEKREKTGKLKNRGRAGDDRSRALYSPLAIPQPNGKTKENSVGERAFGVK